MNETKIVAVHPWRGAKFVLTFVTTRMKARVAGLLLGMVSVGGFCTPAWAIPGEWAVGGELGAGRSTRTTWSPSLGLRGGYGVGEALDVQLELSGQWVRSEQEQDSTNDALFRLVPSLVYKLDVLRWVPFARLGAGPTLNLPLSNDEGARLALAIQGALGVDYLIDRSVSRLGLPIKRIGS